LVDGAVEHIDDAGKLLGRRFSVPVPGDDGHTRWVPHDADLAVESAPSSAHRSGDPDGRQEDRCRR
jgi:hypothetical protein